MKLLATLMMGCLGASWAWAGVSVNVPGAQVQVQGSSVNIANNESGTIDPGAQIEGVTIINGQVFIDGEKVPNKTGTYTSRKTKKTYKVVRDPQGNVSVSEK